MGQEEQEDEEEDEEVIDDGAVIELRCTYDPATRAGATE